MLQLQDGTPVRLRTQSAIYSVEVHTGDKLNFEVAEDVLLQGVSVIERGTIAAGTVIDAQRKRRIARGDRLSIRIDSVRLADGKTVRLRGVKNATGKNHVGIMTGAMAASGVLFFPAAPFFLFLHGKDLTIPKGTEVIGYLDGDTLIDPIRFKVQRSDTASAVADGALAQLDISCTPTGADIEIDGKLAGSSPGLITLPPGAHRVVVKKPGFSTWEKRISISPGETMISVELLPN